ncbi:uncharacterized protein C5orf52 homolog [Mauremys reevesii]|uniref:uncharacterized protein C5orf52 homolog n=1 Tax=Mauremys reevesii TaxID=260615 RepID=UPI00193F26CC|nr:uncharacterized protein C5orf52 homolog [Mauremys reevesii]
MEEQKVSRPRVTFFQPRVNQVLVLFSLFNGSEVAVKRFLPKSHLSTVIIRDNTSVQRIQEIKVNHLEETKIKTSHFYEHLKKKFMSDQQKKISRWKKESDKFGKILELINQRTKNLAIASASLTMRKSQEGNQKTIPRKEATVMFEK